MISPVDYTIDESATLVAVCVGTGFPVPSISWSFNGSPLENNTRVSIYEEVIVESGITFVQSFLEVCSVGFMDAGLYQCTVGNRIANASSYFTLTVNRVGGEQLLHRYRLAQAKLCSGQNKDKRVPNLE